MWKLGRFAFKDVPVIGWSYDMHRRGLLKPAGYVLIPAAILGVPLVLFLYLRGFAYLLMDAYRLLGAPPETVSETARVSFILALIPAAFLLAWFKRKRQFFYGYIELWAGLLVSVRALNTGFSADRDSNAVILVGALYVLSRGASNMLEGATDQRARQRKNQIDGV